MCAPLRWDGGAAVQGRPSLKHQEERMKPDFSFSNLLLDQAEKGEKFTR